jgi:hypothetical protein
MCSFWFYLGLGHVRSANGNRYIMDSVGVGPHIWSPTSLDALATLLPSHDCVSTEHQQNVPVPAPVSAPVPPLVPVPFQAPVPAPGPAPETAPVTSPTSRTDCSSFTVKFAADQWPGDNDFYLQNLETGDFVWNEFNFQKFEVRTKRTCIDNSGCHYFDLWDAAGDGILSPGFVTLTYAGQQLYFGGNFGRGIVAYFGDGCAAYQ